MATATSTAPCHLRVARHAKTSAAVMTVTGIGSPSRTSRFRIAGSPPRLDRTRASTAVSNQPARVLCVTNAPRITVTATQTAKSAAARGRIVAGSRAAHPGSPELP